MSKVLVIFSGGLDSTVLLTSLVRGKFEGDEIQAIGFDYGQRHKKELQAAKEIATTLGVRYDIVDLSSLGKFLEGSSQTDAGVPVPHGHYEEESMKATVVPNRNMIMIAVAAGIASSRKFDHVAYAAHGGDHAIYPDCRPDFVVALEGALMKADWNPVQLLAPYLNHTKADLVKLGNKLNAPLALTWSCYEGGEKHCGICGTDVERRLAFQEARVIDPTEYANPLPDNFAKP